MSGAVMQPEHALDLNAPEVSAPELSALELIAARAGLARAAAQNLPSPCISVCHMNPQSGLCAGCYRTIDEIRLWSRADDAAKRVVWARIEKRLVAEQA